jgi:DNA-binding transcriptional LysR family regulator
VIGKGFDAGIRFAESIPPDMVAIAISGKIRSVVVGSPEYFRKHPVPTSPADLMQHNCIRSRLARGELYKWELERAGEQVAIDVPGQLTLDEAELSRQAALHHIGLACLPEPVIARDIADRTLVPILEDWNTPYPGFCLYHPRARHMAPKLRAFVDIIHLHRDGH